MKDFVHGLYVEYNDGVQQKFRKLLKEMSWFDTVPYCRTSRLLEPSGWKPAIYTENIGT